MLRGKPAWWQRQAHEQKLQDCPAQTLPGGLLCARSGYTGARRGKGQDLGEQDPGHTLWEEHQGGRLSQSGASGILVL